VQGSPEGDPDGASRRASSADARHGNVRARHPRAAFWPPLHTPIARNVQGAPEGDPGGASRRASSADADYDQMPGISWPHLGQRPFFSRFSRTAMPVRWITIAPQPGQ